MEKRKYLMSEFAEILGVSLTSIRRKITEDPATGMKRYKERFEITTEMINGRSVAVILMSDLELAEEKRLAQINKNLYTGKSNVSELESVPVYDNVIEAEKVETISEIPHIANENLLSFTERYIERLENLNKSYNERVDSLKDEIYSYKSQIPKLEDKASREGAYLNEIKTLQDDKKGLEDVIKTWTNRFIILLITFVISFMGFSIYLIYKINHPTVIEKTNTIEKIIEKPVIQTVKKR